jgi:transposase-like protein
MTGVTQEQIQPPKACPACRSIEFTTTSKTVTVTSYWRCLRCGEIWNQERSRAADRYSPRRW